MFGIYFGQYLKGPVDIERITRYEQWDSLTSKFSAVANIPFLLLQMPQIILNAQNLLAGNKTALFAVSWLVRHSRKF